MLAKTVSEAARFIADQGLVKEGAQVLLKFVTRVAARFGVVVSQKVAAQALPIVGALGGAAVNYAFMEYFQDVAHGHITVRRVQAPVRQGGGALRRVRRDRCAGEARQLSASALVPWPFPSGSYVNRRAWLAIGSKASGLASTSSP